MTDYRTLRARPVADEWWQPYTEEWLVPPVERATRTAEKQSFYSRLSSPLVRMLLLKGGSREREETYIRLMRWPS